MTAALDYITVPRLAVYLLCGPPHEPGNSLGAAELQTSVGQQSDLTLEDYAQTTFHGSSMDYHTLEGNCLWDERRNDIAI